MTREGNWWVAIINGITGAATETTRLDQLEIEVRDLIAGLLDIDDDAFELSWDFSSVIGKKGQDAWDAFVVERAELEELKRKFDADRLTTLRALKDAGISTRESAALVEISHQRVHQLINA